MFARKHRCARVLPYRGVLLNSRVSNGQILVQNTTNNGKLRLNGHLMSEETTPGGWLDSRPCKQQVKSIQFDRSNSSSVLGRYSYFCQQHI